MTITAPNWPHRVEDSVETRPASKQKRPRTCSGSFSYRCSPNSFKESKKTLAKEAQVSARAVQLANIALNANASNAAPVRHSYQRKKFSPNIRVRQRNSVAVSSVTPVPVPKKPAGGTTRSSQQLFPKLSPGRRTSSNSSGCSIQRPICLSSDEENESLSSPAPRTGVRTRSQCRINRKLFVFPPNVTNAVTVYSQDLDRLEVNVYLNDTIIDFYLKYCGLMFCSY